MTYYNALYYYFFHSSTKKCKTSRKKSLQEKCGAQMKKIKVFTVKSFSTVPEWTN